MALSYLLTTVAVVLFAQIVLTRIALKPTSAKDDLTAQALNAARQLAKEFAGGKTGGAALGDPRAAVTNGRAVVAKGAVVVPYIVERDTGQDTADAVVFDEQLRVIATSFPARYRAGETLPQDLLPQVKKALGGATDGGGLSVLSKRENGPIVLAVAPVPTPEAQATTKAPRSEPTIPSAAEPPRTYVYLEAPAKTDARSVPVNTVLLIALLAAPVGLAFGWLATRGPRRRLDALARASASIAAGDLDVRLDPESNDELGQLESHFNAMAEQIESGTRRERQLAVENARLGERNRISRELHDALSQELFSMTLLSGGLRQALSSPHNNTSTLDDQAAQLQAAAERATEELRSLLLDLRPAVLAAGGLAPALEALAKDCSARFGLTITTDLTACDLEPATEHALVRVAQEALTNAAKHADATQAEVRTSRNGDRFELVVRDNGVGYDPSATTEGFGQRLMSERMELIDGALTITSEPGQTEITASVQVEPTP
jgi:signal transduction histidine kinase